MEDLSVLDEVIRRWRLCYSLPESNAGEFISQSASEVAGGIGFPPHTIRYWFVMVICSRMHGALCAGNIITPSWRKVACFLETRPTRLRHAFVPPEGWDDPVFIELGNLNVLDERLPLPVAMNGGVTYRFTYGTRMRVFEMTSHYPAIETVTGIELAINKAILGISQLMNAPEITRGCAQLFGGSE